MNSAVLVPELSSTRQAARGLVLTLRVPTDLAYFQGHFPQCPVLPGVVQIDWAVHFAGRHFPLRGHFRELTGLKFMRVILPGRTVELTLAYTPERGQLRFQYAVSELVCSSGTVVFAVPV
jgi:3-hydroxymyristoyl/3-hydroxydecanoyl-(acyl carrier protein) dehydratase